MRPLLWGKDTTLGGCPLLWRLVSPPEGTVTGTVVPANARARAEWLSMFRVVRAPVRDGACWMRS